MCGRLLKQIRGCFSSFLGGEGDKRGERHPPSRQTQLFRCDSAVGAAQDSQCDVHVLGPFPTFHVGSPWVWIGIGTKPSVNACVRVRVRVVDLHDASLISEMQAGLLYSMMYTQLMT